MQNENVHSLVGIEDCFLNFLYKIQLKLSLCIFIFDCLKTFLRMLFSCILCLRTDLCRAGGVLHLALEIIGVHYNILEVAGICFCPFPSTGYLAFGLYSNTEGLSNW